MIREIHATGREPSPSRTARPAAGSKQPATRDAARAPAPLAHRAEVARATNDALSIARMSQSIIQRAMTISLQLRSIAASAIASGRVNTQRLDETIFQMRSALGDYGGQVTAPSPSSAPAPRTDLAAEISSMGEISTDIRAGRYDRIADIDSVISRLGEKLADAQSAGAAADALTGGSAGAGLTGIQANPGILVARVREHIASAPAEALSVQGNINHEAALRLMT